MARTAILATLALLLVAGLPLTLQTEVSASGDDTSWTQETIPSAASLATAAVFGRNGEDIALAWDSSSLVEFATRDSTTHAWTVRSTNINALMVCPIQVVGYGASKWMVFGFGAACTTTSTFKFYQSTDNGVTWTAGTLPTGICTSTCHAQDLKAGYDDTTGRVWVQYEGTTGTAWRIAYTTDGATWVNHRAISNDGSPSDASTAEPCTTGPGAMGTRVVGNNAVKIERLCQTTTPNCGVVASSTDDATWWTEPYTSHLGSTVSYAWTENCNSNSVNFGLTLTPTLTVAHYTGTDYYSITPDTVSSTPTHWQPCGTGATLIDEFANVKARAPASGNANGMNLFAVKCAFDTNPLTLYFYDGAQFQQTFQTTKSTTNRFREYMTPLRSYVVFEDNTFAGRITIMERKTPTTFPAAPHVVVSTPYVIGFAMDHSGHNIVLRQQAVTSPYGSDIRSYDAVSLANTGLNHEDCARNDGLDAVSTVYGDFLVYADCNTSGLVDGLHIRDGRLGLAVLPTCTSDYYCNHDPHDAGFPNDINFPGQTLQLASLKAYPYYYDTQSRVFGLNHQARFDYAYSTFDGKIGAHAVVYNKNSLIPDYDVVTERTISSSAPTQLCSWLDDEQRQYIAAVAFEGATASYEVKEYYDTLPYDNPQAHIDFDPAFVNGGGYAYANALACAGADIWFFKTDTHTIYKFRVVGTLVQEATKVLDYDLTNRGLAASQDGTCLIASGADGNIHVLDSTTFAEKYSFQPPAGEPVLGIATDINCQVAWVATTNHLAREVIWQYTTGSPKSATVDDYGTPLDGGAADTTDPVDGKCPVNRIPVTIDGVPKCKLKPPPTSTGTPTVSTNNDLGTNLKAAFSSIFGGFWGWLLTAILAVVIGLLFTNQWGPHAGLHGVLLAIAFATVTGMIDLWFLLVVVLAESAMLVWGIKNRRILA